MIFNNCSVIHLFYDECDTYAVRLEKNRQMSIKLAQNDFTRKIKDFDSFTKIPKECECFGQINCCQKLLKVAQSPINRQIWSHCTYAGVHDY